MRVTTTRRIDAPLLTVWSLQIDHPHWPEQLPNFRRVERIDAGAPFGLGSSAIIEQPGLGSVTWTVSSFEDHEQRKAYAWSGKARGVVYTGRHMVVADGDGTLLTLEIEMAGALAPVLGPLARRTVQKAIEAEAAAFAAWADEVTAR